MRIGIVGSEAAKFTAIGQERAKEAIKTALTGWMSPATLVSGHCHLGGIDIWAEELADELGLDKMIFPPREHNWSNGYKPRNLQIAHNSEIVICITVDKLPIGYGGMTFPVCYHCARAKLDTNHTKSGGCWTTIQAMKTGKEGKWIVIVND